ncbi:MAG: serine/threonine protein phosphatase [Bacteroidales bacterium]|nr:serine/threonine protein phosphatase [Bacteroidales bacterium]
MSKRLLAIGDTHGCYVQLYTLVTELISLSRNDRLVLLGDYIDRGPDSKQVMEFIMDLKDEGYDVIALKGNHEDMMLHAADSPLDNYNWMLNGGYETLRSFDVVSVQNIDKKYMDFLSILPPYYISGNYIFVHGGFNDDIDDPFSDEYSMLWERRNRYDSPVFRGKTIVHGHRPHPVSELKEEIKKNPALINMDTGCVYGKEGGLGNLTAIDLTAMKLFSVSC